MPHVVLLGDSIFDNGAYTGGGPDVISQLKDILPPGWQATLAAVDGATTDDVAAQWGALAADVTHAVLSVGGNDAISHADLLNKPVRSSAEALARLADAGERFEARYRRVIARLPADDIALAVCTIYNGSFPDPAFQRVASAALSVFNDAILRVAFEEGLTVIDLRLICDQPGDYANPIEPSVSGGAKIAAAIARMLELPPSASHVARVLA